MNRLLDLELERNELVRAVVAAYQELTEGEKALFRLAAGITQDGAIEAIDPSHRSSNDGNDETHPDQVQPIIRNLMKSLLEDHPSLLTDTDIANLMDRDYTQRILGLQLAGFPLLRRRETGRRGSDSDRQDRFYARLYAGRFYVCSQWWKDYHLANARGLLMFVGELASRDPDHPGIPVLERHMRALREYIDRDPEGAGTAGSGDQPTLETL